MRIYGKSRFTTASPERVWRVWSDPTNWSRWNTGIRSCEMNGPLASGTKGKMQTSRGTKHAVTFAEVAPPRRFTLSMNGPPFTRFTFICEVKPNGSGSTIAQSVAFSGPLAFIFGPMFGERMSDQFMPVLDDLAAAAEGA